MFRFLFPRKKIVSSLIGGLGNQMFQYAAGRALAARLHGDLVLDTAPLHVKADHTPRAYGLDAFKIRATLDDLNPDEWSKLTVLEEGEVPGEWPRKIKGNVRISGHWQSERFFSSIRPQLLKDFALSEQPNAHVASIAERIRGARNSVSVHFRRGDYVSLPSAAKFHGTCSNSYYHAGIEHLRQMFGELDLYVFSDDPQWVKQEANLPGNITLVECENSSPAQDIWLMSLCRHHIIANSSFSWWGAWLGASDGVTIAPQCWFLDPAAAQSHIVPSRWVRL